MSTNDPPPGSGRTLLRAAIDASGLTAGYVAKEVFGVSEASMSDWLSGNNRPRPEHRAVALEWGGVPGEAWETEAERARRLRARELAPAKPASTKKPAPKTKPRPSSPPSSSPAKPARPGRTRAPSTPAPAARAPRGTRRSPKVAAPAA
jgi:hypothetical protein